MDPCSKRIGVIDDSGRWIFLFWTDWDQISSVIDHVVFHLLISRVLSGNPFPPNVLNLKWFFWGYSLVFSKSASKFLGNMENIGFTGVLAQKSGNVPDILYAFFQGMFAAFTPAIVIGAAAERGRILPCLVFVFVWTTLVYDPIASWTWNNMGWANVLGVLDFAGGTPVHISSGAAALAFAWKLGPRLEKLNSKVPYLTMMLTTATQYHLHCIGDPISMVWLAWI